MPNNILITPGSASIQFSGSAANTIRLQVESSGSIAFYGNSGSLFGITDSLSGSLMSVNDISGLPILEVFSDDRVVMGTFNKNTLVVTGSRVGIDKAVPTTDLDISGSVFITGSLRMSSGGITGSLFGTSSWANNSISSSFSTTSSAATSITFIPSTSSFATTASYALSSAATLPSGVVSSSTQINTGSFSGSFTGALIGTSSWANNSISSSFATTSSAATSITFIPATASFATSASFAVSASYAPSAGSGITSLTAGNGLTGGEITSTGTITLDTGSAHFLDGVKKELNTEGVISSSIQINTGSFSGSFTGELIGTASYAMSASYVLNAISSSFATTASAADSITFIPPTASFATTAVSASYFTGSVTFPSGLIVTGSILATTVSASLFIGPLTGTASFATSASFAPPTFPFTGSAIISGSLITTGSVRILSGSISSSGPQAGLLLSGSNTTLTIIPESDGIRYYSVNTGHTFRVGNVDALNIQAFSLSPITANQSTLGISGVRWGTGFINNIVASGSITTTGSLNILSGSINITNGGVTSSLFGTASNATSASYALSASYAPGGAGTVTQVNTGDGLSGGPITGTGTITLDTGSVHFLDGVKKELNTESVISSSAFTSPSQGTVRATINSVQTDVDTGLQTGDSPTFAGLTVNTSIFTPIISASVITGSHVQLVNITDTTSANKVLVLDTVTNKIFTTSSVGSGGGGGSGNGFPYDGTITPAVITGSLLISSSVANPVTIQGSANDFFELEIFNASNGNNASADIVASNNATTDFGNYIDMGINSTAYAGPLVGGPSDGYLYFTSSVGELHIGNASTSGPSNVRLFAGGPSSDANTRLFISGTGHIGIGTSTNLQNILQVQGNVSASSYTSSISNGVGYFGTSSFAITAHSVKDGIIITGSLTSGSVSNLSELSMAVSGTIPANGTTSVTLNLNTANYFAVSGSSAGTITWAVTNPPVTGRAQTFVIEYTNGGIKTNSWFTNTRWPAGIAPSLTSASPNPDILSFTTDDAGANWRGLLLQRGSA